MRVLFAFLPDQHVLGVADLAYRADLPPSTARRLANELVAAGALDQNPDGRYVIGRRLCQLSTLAAQESLRAVAAPVLGELYDGLKQHVQLAVLEGDHAVVIEWLPRPGSSDLLSRVGAQLPLHSSGVGKVLLAYSPQAHIDEVLGSGLPRQTASTVVDPMALRRELAQVRRTGVAFVRSELTADADSVATPVTNRQGRVVAALSIVGRSGAVPLSTAAVSIVASGQRLSRLLGWRGGSMTPQSRRSDSLNGMQA